MNQRLIDYAWVLLAVLLLSGLFKFSRYLLSVFLKKQIQTHSQFTSDFALVWGMRFFLIGMILLPFVSGLLAFHSSSHLLGGIYLHLLLTAVSVVFFSFAEDLFRDYNNFDHSAPKPISWHAKQLALPLVLFWTVGVVFLSPVFYSGLTLLSLLFYRLCLFFRKKPSIAKSNK